jgi:hypothetical protein
MRRSLERPGWLPGREPTRCILFMPSKHPLMKLSRDEETFLRHWMYDEVHYQDGPGPAKRLQLQHRAVPADLATLIAAAIPDPADQEAAGLGPAPPEPPTWPWSEESLRTRIAEARVALGAVAVTSP